MKIQLLSLFMQRQGSRHVLQAAPLGKTPADGEGALQGCWIEIGLSAAEAAPS
jgi:hypothetical protein